MRIVMLSFPIVGFRWSHRTFSEYRNAGKVNFYVIIETGIIPVAMPAHIAAIFRGQRSMVQYAGC